VLTALQIDLNIRMVNQQDIYDQTGFSVIADTRKIVAKDTGRFWFTPQINGRYLNDVWYADTFRAVHEGRKEAFTDRSINYTSVTCSTHYYYHGTFLTPLDEDGEVTTEPWTPGLDNAENFGVYTWHAHYYQNWLLLMIIVVWVTFTIDYSILWVASIYRSKRKWWIDVDKLKSLQNNEESEKND